MIFVHVAVKKNINIAAENSYNIRSFECIICDQIKNEEIDKLNPLFKEEKQELVMEN